MGYKHILVAADLSPESNILLEKAVSVAKPYKSQVSIIHVGINYSDLYTGLVDININDMKDRISEDAQVALRKLADEAGYPIAYTLSANGEFGQVLIEAIQEYDIDLVVCGHHQDFWSKLMSSARQLINNTHVDTLIVPLKDDEPAEEVEK